MGKNGNATSLGGQVYDVFSSKPIAGRVIDGFIKKTSSRDAFKGYASKAKSSVSPLIVAPANAASTGLRRSAQSVHRGAQRSKTLMRGGLTKPITIKRSGTSSDTNTRSLKSYAYSINPLRVARAKTATKNASVQRYNLQKDSKVESLPATKTSPIAGEVLPGRSKLSAATATARPLPSMITSVSHHQIERLLDQALFKADAHRKALRGQLPGQSRFRRVLARPKWLTVGSGLLAILLLAGFFAWQNVPQVSMRLAASNAHVSASVPGYTPAGFSFNGPISHTGDAVKMNFKATADTNRSFAITQQSSSEDSASLVANNLPDSSEVQTSQVNGTTVYIYGHKNDATWVSHGVRYTIEDRANLNSDQILKIANSL